MCPRAYQHGNQKFSSKINGGKQTNNEKPSEQTNAVEEIERMGIFFHGYYIILLDAGIFFWKIQTQCYVIEEHFSGEHLSNEFVF